MVAFVLFLSLFSQVLTSQVLLPSKHINCSGKKLDHLPSDLGIIVKLKNKANMHKCMYFCHQFKECNMIAYKKSECTLLRKSTATKRKTFTLNGHKIYANIKCNEEATEFKSEKDVIILESTCCANKLENKYYDNNNLAIVLNKGFNAVENCYRTCNALNNPGPKICLGFSWNKNYSYCVLYVNNDKNANVSLPCSDDEDHLEMDQQYDYYCNIYCENQTDVELPPEKCPPYTPAPICEQECLDPCNIMVKHDNGTMYNTSVCLNGNCTSHYVSDKQYTFKCHCKEDQNPPFCAVPKRDFEKDCLSIKHDHKFFYQGSCFVARNVMKYKDAKKACNDMSPKYPKGHLAHTKDQSLLDQIEKNFLLAGSPRSASVVVTSYWLGFAQKDKKDEPAGHWYWIDSEGNFVESADEMLKPLWNEGEPNNYANKEECGIYWYLWTYPKKYQKLNDYYCEVERNFICQYHEHKDYKIIR